MLIGGRAHNVEEVEEIAKLGLDFAEISFTDPHAVLQQIPTLVALRNQYDLFYLALLDRCQP